MSRFFWVPILLLALSFPAAAQGFPISIPPEISRQLPFPVDGGIAIPIPQADFPFPIPQGRIDLPEGLPSIIITSARLPRYPVPAPAPQPQPRRQPQPVPGPGAVGSPPPGYDAITYAGRPVRVQRGHLPLRVYNSDPGYSQAFDQALNLWNRTGVEMEMGSLFIPASPAQADFQIDWTGRGVPAGVRAQATMSLSRSRAVPSGVSVRPGSHSQDALGRVLSHELGHVLGLDHSSGSGDLMARSEDGRAALGLSGRDRQMFTWLYAQSDYIPVVGASRTPAAGFAGVSTNFR